MNRAIHLVDVENLMEGTDFDAAAAAAIRSLYTKTAGLMPDDHVVVASSHAAAEATWFGWPAARRLPPRSGPNGADLALIEVIQREELDTRYGRVVVASGDGDFAEACAGLQAAGCSVTAVVRREKNLSRHLALAVRDIRFLEPEVVAATAASALRRAA